MTVPTVKIKKDSARGWSIINESDFDPEIHELFGAPEGGPVDVAGMKKDEVREVLDAHGVEYDGRAKLSDLRALAQRVMFVDL